jgi:AcrR family transcriptional regulator
MSETLLDAAAEILVSDGPGAVTMKRVAARLQWSVGAIYRYVPSKEALITAAVQAEVARLVTAQRAARALTQGLVERVRDQPQLVALAHLRAEGWFWVDAAHSLPRALAVTLPLVLHPSPTRPEAPLASTLLSPLGQRFDEAGATGSVRHGDARWRSHTTVAAVATVASVPSPEHVPDPSRTVAGRLLDCLLRGWATSPDLVDVAGDLLDLETMPAGSFAAADARQPPAEPGQS